MAASGGDGQWYIVVSGDTLWALAKSIMAAVQSILLSIMPILIPSKIQLKNMERVVPVMDIGSGQAKNYGFRQEDDMSVRIGRVTSVNSTEGRVKVAYEDSRSSSLPLPMLSMNNEYSMPKIGDRVLTVHMDNGSSKGFVFGTFYGGGSQPKANSGYRKDFDGAYLVCAGGHYQLQAAQITFNAESSDFIACKGRNIY